MAAPVAASHTRAVLSEEAVTIRVPSGEKAALCTETSWPLRVAMAAPVAASHTCATAAQVVKKAPRRGAHRKRRERAPLPGMMVHQDGSTHPWVLGCVWDLIVTMDDATGEHLSMFFVEE